MLKIVNLRCLDFNELLSFLLINTAMLKTDSKGIDVQQIEQIRFTKQKRYGSIFWSLFQKS